MWSAQQPRERAKWTLPHCGTAQMLRYSTAPAHVNGPCAPGVVPRHIVERERERIG